MTVDVEDYFHVQAFAHVIDQCEWDSYPIRVERNTVRILDIFAERQIRATFFILGWVADRCPGLVKAICRANHRLGCHSYAHRAIFDGSQQGFREDLRRAKQVIEDHSGMAVTSFRAPSFSITEKTLWALEILGEEGFECDSSIFPIVHDTYGIPEAPRFPHIRELGVASYIKEFPPSTIRMLGRNFPVAGGGYLRLLPYRITKRAIRYLNEIERQPAMVYLHPWEIDPDQPRIAASLRSRVRHYQNLQSTEVKCRQLLDDFSWAPMEEVLTNSLVQ